MASLGLEGFDLGAPLQWNLISRRTFVAQQDANGFWIPLGSFTSSSPSPLLCCGFFDVNAPVNWFTGGWVSLGASVSVDSGQTGLPIIYTGNYRCRLNGYTLLHYPNVNPKPYIVRVDFPKWLRRVIVELWYYEDYPPLNYDLTLLGIYNAVGQP